LLDLFTTVEEGEKNYEKDRYDIVVDECVRVRA
jgi:hypothetical protein